MLSAFESRHDELSHRKWVEHPKHNGSSFLQAPFEQRDIKSRVIEHSAHTPASQILLVAFNKGVSPPRNCHQRCLTTNRTQNLPKDDQFAAGIAMIAIDHPPQPHGRNCPTATSSQTPKCGNHGPQIPAQTACASSPTRQPEPESLGTFHSV